jgi:ribonuclease HII
MSQQPNLDEERALWALGYEHIAGIDEAGRGAWAGPVVAAAVILPPHFCPPVEMALVRDSKLLSPGQRDRCFEVISRHALAIGVGLAPSTEIDALGIISATKHAMTDAVRALSVPPLHLLIDAVRLEALSVPQRAIIKGDRACLSIAAASIVAKVTRDRWMAALEGQRPGYGFARHKGYGTERHRLALAERGPCDAHRRTFAPIRTLIERRPDD